MASPKPPGARRRRNADQATWKQLPVTGTSRKPPALPRRVKGAWSASTREWWRDVWRSPMAAMYVDADRWLMWRAAELMEQLKLYPDRASLHGELTRIGDRLGWSPKARRTLMWEIARTSPTDPPAPAQMTRRMRAVDPVDEGSE